MPTILIIIAVAVALAILIVAVILIIRARRFRPTKDKLLQLARLNSLLEPSGFAYDPQGDFFYSLVNSWQRDMGYCRHYDEAAPFFNMVMDCAPISFSYGGKRWLIELWKGQYGITSGAEIGVYNTSRPDVASDEFTGTFYEAVSDEEMLRFSMTLRRGGTVLFKRRARHWWLTGFHLGLFSQPEALALDARIRFPEPAMRDAFAKALQAAGYQEGEFKLGLRSVLVHFTKPHQKQPDSMTGPQRLIAQGLNETNCTLYQTATAEYTDTMDKLEFLESMAPELFSFLLGSLYARGVFDAFGWLKPLLPPPAAPTPMTPCLPPPPRRKPPRQICDPCSQYDPCDPYCACQRDDPCKECDLCGQQDSCSGCDSCYF